MKCPHCGSALRLPLVDLGSVPRSLNDPITTNATNIDGFLNMLVAARDAKVNSFTYAASSSTYGDGETSRDFCYVDNAVQANLLAATTQNPDARNQVYNVAVGDRTTLNTLFGLLRDHLQTHGVAKDVQPVYRDFRAGDVRHSQADIEKARRLLGYAHTHRLADGIAEAMPWYAALTTTAAQKA